MMGREGETGGKRAKGEGEGRKARRKGKVANMKVNVQENRKREKCQQRAEGKSEEALE